MVQETLPSKVMMLLSKNMTWPGEFISFARKVMDI